MENVMTITELLRKCPGCGVELRYKQLADFKKATNIDRLCRSCVQIKKNYPVLTNLQENFIIGSLLGDGHFIKNNTSNFGFGLTHSNNQREYAEFKSRLLPELGGKIYTRDRFDNRTLKTYSEVSVRFNTHPFITDLSHKMVLNGKKSVNREILELLSPFGIMIWYCDDGNLYRNGDINHLTLATNGFISDVPIIIEYFNDVWDIKFKSNKDGSIRITNMKEILKFMKIVKIHVPSCMEYKVV